jgi:carbamoyl-phosphate synthase small subunit
VKKPALLALADGSLFPGAALGLDGSSVGEVVFNTSMTGYQEMLTDPSYARQIITLTYPHIGNVGVNPDDEESPSVWAAGLVIRDLSLLASSWRQQQNLDDYLIQHRVVGISDIDTRRLTRILREQGAQAGCIVSGNFDEAEAIAKARNFAGLQHVDLAKVVSTKQPYQWQQGSWHLEPPHYLPAHASLFPVVVYDFGVKRHILQMLVDRGCQVSVVPATTPAHEVIALNPAGVVLSNGPGDPAACDYAIAAIRELLSQNMPLFGICLGHQLLALASDALTVKMKFGHHGSNHPVQDVTSKEVFITSQNHGFTVSEDNLPPWLEVTHRSLFDGTIQGIKRLDKPAFSFQGHPEGSGGPLDIAPLFDQFIAMMTAHKHTDLSASKTKVPMMESQHLLKNSREI